VVCTAIREVQMRADLEADASADGLGSD
jgi:hypothetical protein